jgi:hypothetical protein
MRSILYLGESLYLIDGKLFQFGAHFKFLNFDDFYGNYLIGFLVDCLVNFSELTFSNHIFKYIVLDLLPHL